MSPPAAAPRPMLLSAPAPMAAGRPAAAPRRVLHLVSTLDRGGTELSMLRLIDSMDRDAWNFRVAWLRGEAPFAGAAERVTGAPPVGLGLRSKVDPGALLRLLRLLRRERIDLVHTHMDLADYYGAAAARLLGLRLVSTKENADEFRTRRTWKRPPFLALEHLSYAAADAVIAVSDGLVEFLSRAERLPRHKTVVIRNGVDAAFAERAPGREAARRRFGLPAGATVLGTVGRLAEQKGQIDLVRALPAIAAAFPAVRLLLAGDGPERAALEAEAARLSVRHRVLWIGHCDDVPAVLAALDLFVLPSLWEGLPLALLEAMTMGLPVVAARAVGIVETIDDGVEGVLVPRRDPAALAAAVVDLLADPARARRLGAAARRRVLERHTLQAVAADIDRLYRRVLAGRA